MKIRDLKLKNIINIEVNEAVFSGFRRVWEFLKSITKKENP